MNCLLLSILIPFFFLTTGCAYLQETLEDSGMYLQDQTKVPTFSTPYGEIEKGASELEVVAVLGIPQRILSVSGVEEYSWRYNLGEDEIYLVYFVNGKAINVISGEDLGPETLTKP